MQDDQLEDAPTILKSTEEKTPEVVLPRKILALDNRAYFAIDLHATEEQDMSGEQKISTILQNIETGVGGYMPRYVVNEVADKDG